MAGFMMIPILEGVIRAARTIQRLILALRHGNYDWQDIQENGRQKRRLNFDNYA